MKKAKGRYNGYRGECGPRLPDEGRAAGGPRSANADLYPPCAVNAALLSAPGSRCSCSRRSSRKIACVLVRSRRLSRRWRYGFRFFHRAMTSGAPALAVRLLGAVSLGVASLGGCGRYRGRW